MKTNDNPQAAWGGTPGEESFDVLMCAPGWLREEIERHGPITGRHLLVVCPLELREAIRFSTCRIEGERAEDWARLGERLSWIGFRELEDYDFSTPLGRRPRQPPVP